MRSSFEIEPQRNLKLDLSYMDAAKKISWFLIVGLLTIVLLCVSLISKTGAATCSQSDIWDPDRHWVYNDHIVAAELANLKTHRTFSNTDTLWFEQTEEQEIKSAANNPGSSVYTGPKTYTWDDYKDKKKPGADWLDYTTISDNTESIAAFEDILHMIPKGALLLDIGGGRYDTAKDWIKKQRNDITMHVADPFNRDKEHNLNVQKVIESKGGADVVTSHSVLNVVKELRQQTAHLWLVYSVLKPGGSAIFKTWAGVWPLRGTRVQEVDDKALTGEDTAMSQNNAFSDAYKPLLEKVFGEGNVFADANMNMLAARKKYSAETPI